MSTHIARPAQVNPARAGMIRNPKMDTKTYICKPRASGDDPYRYDNLVGRPS